MTTQLAFRLSDRLVTGIDRLVETRKFTSRTEVVRVALEQLLERTRRSELDAAIVGGYRRVPDEPTDPWVDAATRALVAEEAW